MYEGMYFESTFQGRLQSRRVRGAVIERGGALLRLLRAAAI
jgi:hypothetical protein